jgi:hypothetical protein
MPRSKKTISRDSVFRSTAAPAEAPAQGVDQEEVITRQTAVWLADKETEGLDDQIQHIKRSGWRGVTRSAFIRALIRTAMQQPVELGGVSDEAELTQRLNIRG